MSWGWPAQFWMAFFSSEHPISLLFVTRWTGSSVMAAAISGFIRSVLVSLQRWQRRKTTSVCAALQRTHQAESKNKTHSLPVIQDSNKKLSSISAKLQDWVKPACARCYFYSLRDHFSRTLWKKEKKKLKKILTLFVFFSLRAVCGCWSLKCWLFFAGVSTDFEGIGVCTFSCTALTLYFCLGFTGLRVQLSFRAQKGHQNSSNPHWATVLLHSVSTLGEFKFFTLGFMFLSFFASFSFW